MTYTAACALRQDRVHAAKRMFENLSSALTPFGPELVKQMTASIDATLTVARDRFGEYDVVALDFDAEAV